MLPFVLQRGRAAKQSGEAVIHAIGLEICLLQLTVLLAFGFGQGSD